MTDETPAVIERFLQAERDGDFEAFAACFIPGGVVLDEGRTHIGRADIAAWRRAAADGPALAAEVTATERLGPEAFRVVQHVVGDFPGGGVDLDYDFALKDDHIAALVIFLQKR